MIELSFWAFQPLYGLCSGISVVSLCADIELGAPRVSHERVCWYRRR